MTAPREITPLGTDELVDPDYLGTGADGSGDNVLHDDKTWGPETGGSGAPTTADYLVGTSQAGLSAEIVVGTTPGGELGGTWGSPTVDATHSGTSHAGAVAAAESYSDAADAAHVAAGDPHTGYQKESEKDANSGYAGLNSSGIVPIAHLATGTPDGTQYVRDDNTLGVPPGTGGGGAPTTADYLVGTAQGGLSAEIVVGATPGGELGGTWGSPTVDATHSGSTHHAQSHDHSSAGDGTTLTPAHLNTPVEAPGTTEGRVGWDGTLRALRVYDSVQSKFVSPAGWAPYGVGYGYAGQAEFSTAVNLAAVSGGNAGAEAIAILLTAPMLLQGYRIWSTDTASLREAEVRLYVDRLNSTNAMDFVAGSDAAFSFTPSAAARQDSGAVSGAPVALPPGLYWAVIRNTLSARTFGIGRIATPTAQPVDAFGAQNTALAALGSTLDITGWTKTASMRALVLRGRVMGQSAAW